MNRRLLSALCFVMLAANAMGEEPVTFPDVEWEVRTPAEVGLDVAKLQELSAMVGGAGAIVRDGYMVYTWGDQNARRPTQGWASASKAVVSTMLFFAINEGRLSGPDVTVRTYVQQQFPGEDLIAKDVPMTFRHLANGLSGYALPEAPGDAYAYNDYAFKLYKYLVFGQLFGVSPTSESEVAEAITAPERLGPLQFQDGSLIAIIKGGPRWNATLRDTARLGWFWLNKGRWKAQQLLPQALFDTYARAQVPANLPRSTSNTPNDYLGLGTDGDTDPNQNRTDPHYGYNWHHNLGTDGTLDVPSAPADLFYAAGNLNKVIAMVPSQKLVAVWRDGPNLTDEQRAAALETFSSAVVTGGMTPQAVVSFTLIDADLDVDIGPLQNGDTLNLSALPTRHLNVRANTSPSPVGSVRFALDVNSIYRTENRAPYSLAGDRDGNYAAWTPSVGSHTLAATPYTGANATGTVGTPLTMTFTVVE